MSMKPDSTETLYIGDSFISGSHLPLNKCYNGDVDIDSYNKLTVDKNYWEIVIKEDDINVRARNIDTVLDSYHFNTNRNG